MQKKRYYVIIVGKCTGIYYDERYVLFHFAFIMLTCHLSTRDNVKHFTDRVSNARYKGFATHREAEEYYILYIINNIEGVKVSRDWLMR
jgi:hypothetical protein